MTETEFTELTKIRLLGEPESMIDDFISYWTEKPLKGGKMRFEREKVFDIKRRFGTWKKNTKNYKTVSYSKPCPIQGTIDAHAEVIRKIENGEI